MNNWALKQIPAPKRVRDLTITDDLSAAASTDRCRRRRTRNDDQQGLGNCNGTLTLTKHSRLDRKAKTRARDPSSNRGGIKVRPPGIRSNTKRVQGASATRAILPSWRSQNPDVKDPHNDECEACGLGGSLTECDNCNCVWHGECHLRLPSRPGQPFYCDLCIAEDNEARDAAGITTRLRAEPAHEARHNKRDQELDEDDKYQEWKRDCDADSSSDEEDAGDTQGPTRTRKHALTGVQEQGNQKKRSVSTPQQKQRQRKPKKRIMNMLDESSGDETDDGGDARSITEGTTQIIERNTQSPQGSRGNGKRKKRRKKKE